MIKAYALSDSRRTILRILFFGLSFGLVLGGCRQDEPLSCFSSRLLSPTLSGAKILQSDQRICSIQKLDSRMTFKKITQSKLKQTENLIHLTREGQDHPSLPPYPGLISKKGHCGKFPSEEVTLKSNTIDFNGFVASANSQHEFEPCPLGEVTHFYYYGILKCARPDFIFELKFVGPGPQEVRAKELSSILMNLKCG